MQTKIDSRYNFSLNFYFITTISVYLKKCNLLVKINRFSSLVQFHESSQVVGWPPIRTYRIQSLVNHAKSPMTEEITSALDKCKSNNTIVDKTNIGSNLNRNVAKEKGLLKKPSLFVKVNMDGIPIGRKVDLNAHRCYKTLSQTLDEMFKLSAAVGATRKFLVIGVNHWKSGCLLCVFLIFVLLIIAFIIGTLA